MALAIDASTPAVAVNSVAGTATVTTVSFTPPANSLLLILWVGNSDATTLPSTPTITDNLGTHLTYHLVSWRSRNDLSPQVSGQAAIWWASVSTSAAMTVTVTNVTNTATQRESVLQPIVLTGADPGTPIGASGKSGSASTAAIAQSYVATATNGWGFIAACDWDATGAPTAGTGCSIASSGDAGTIVGQISYGMARRTTADDSNGSSNTLNVTLAGTSTNAQWAYAEVLPLVTAGSASVPPVVVATTPLPAAPQPATIRRGSLSNPPVLTTPQPLVVSQPYARLLPPPTLQVRASLADPPTPPPIVVSTVTVPARTPAVVLRGGTDNPPVLTTPGPVVVDLPYNRVLPPPSVMARASLADAVVPVAATPGPVVVSTVTVPTRTPAVITRGGTDNPPVLTTSAPLIVALTAPGQLPPVGFIGRASLVDPPTPPPLVVPVPPAQLQSVPQARILRSSLVDPTATQPVVVVAPWTARVPTSVLVRSSLADPFVAPTTPAPPPIVSRTAVRPWLYQPVILSGAVRCSCVVPRPGSGTTSRPGSGTTARPNTGTTVDPCC